MTQIQTKDTKNSLKSADLSDRLLPRQGWQDKQALIRAMIKAKRTLDVVEISHLLD